MNEFLQLLFDIALVLVHRMPLMKIFHLSQYYISNIKSQNYH